ncbi:MAG: DUF4428 domain-containing protein, partial [Clostridia bacterium]|nr:DUF4428 domain-containing protein [Clostridia bacterium]
MGLFKKENCCICGEKTGLLDKKCQDGKVCKECRNKLSVWFDDYANTDALHIKGQIEVRKIYRDMAKVFDFNKIFGEFGVILIDEKERKFIAFPSTSTGFFGSQRKVRSIDDVIDLGPDVIEFDQVRDFEIDITETTREEKQTVNGQQVSYDPQRILYMETFTLRMTLKHPYIKRIYIQLNDGAVQIKNLGRRLWTDPGRRLAAHLLDLPGLIKEDQEAVFDNESLLHVFLRSEYEMPDYSYGFKCTPENWDDIKKYRYYLAMA